MEPEKKSNGALLGLIIIIIILIVGGIYLWQTNRSKVIENPQSLAVTPADSASLNTLEQDLNSTSTNIDVNVDTLK